MFCYKPLEIIKKNYDDLANANTLMKAAKDCMRGVTWKYSTQAYYLNRFERIRATQNRLKAMQRMSDGFVAFTLRERGKERLIQSIHINERVVQKAENNEILLPEIRPRLIYDNYASLENRGLTFALERVKAHLQQHYRKYGREGYVVVADLHGYFNNIQHKPVYEYYKRLFNYDPRITYLTMDFIDAFGEKSLGLGSQVSQITAVAYPNKIDHFIKEQLKIKHYGRYMDDFYAICRTKEEAWHYLETVEKMYLELGIELNKRKTQIIPLRREFTFLKKHIGLTETGKVIIRPNRDSITTERRKLKKLSKKYNAGEITFFECQQAYVSWRGYIEHFNSFRTLQNMDALFKELFHKDWRYKDHAKKRKQLNYRGEYKRYDYPSRHDPAERRYGTELEAQW